MGRLGVVGGHSLLGSSFAADASVLEISANDADPIRVLDAGDYVFLQRHGHDQYHPPHLIDHVANVRALHSIGCDRILAVGSVGGLQSDHVVGGVVAPHDFIALDHVVSGFDDAHGHRVPDFDPAWRHTMIDAWNDASTQGGSAGAGATAAVLENCVYWQTAGPRFETPAEIRLLSQFADVVGMTIASECIVAGELGLAYAAICVIDNLANGVREEVLTPEQFEAGKAANRAATVATLGQAARSLARTA